ncbi:MAG: hypothetical protein IJ481_03020 [Alphaproteobacteria bacterium]|nr:hypothetical protein [Alphaproteobacteria bacterium]
MLLNVLSLLGLFFCQDVSAGDLQDQERGCPGIYNSDVANALDQDFADDRMTQLACAIAVDLGYSITIGR